MDGQHYPGVTLAFQGLPFAVQAYEAGELQSAGSEASVQADSGQQSSDAENATPATEASLATCPPALDFAAIRAQLGLGGRAASQKVRAGQEAR